MLPDELSPDCPRCSGLCCIALAFDAGPAFAHNKPAHVACAHLSRADRCRIHPALHAQGYGGCAAYSCHGAGQYVTQTLFGGRSWRDLDEPAAMFAAFDLARDWFALRAQATLAAPRAPPGALRDALHAVAETLRVVPRPLTHPDVRRARGQLQPLLARLRRAGRARGLPVVEK